MFMEAFAGSAVLTQELVRLGFTGRAYECSPDGPKGDYLPEGDIERPENQNEIAEAIVNDKVFQLHASPSCTTWTPFQALNETTRTLDRPEGDGTLEKEVEGNRLMAISLFLVIMCIAYGVFFTLEHPKPSRVWRLPLVLFLLTLPGIFLVEFDQCAWVKRPGDWDPAHGDVRTKKCTYMLTNNPHMRVLGKKCADTGPHTHETVMGLSRTGEKRSAESAEFSKLLAKVYASATRAAWLQGSKPAKQATHLLKITLAKLMEDVALEPPPAPKAVANVRSTSARHTAGGQKPLTSTQRPVYAKGASGSREEARDDERIPCLAPTIRRCRRRGGGRSAYHSSLRSPVGERGLLDGDGDPVDP